MYLGDNLRVNSTAGFQQSFHCKNFCRLCRATKQQCKELTVQQEYLIRTIENDEKDFKNGARGVVGPCILNELQLFHFTENLTEEVMHYIFEGVARDNIEEVSTSLI